MAGRCIKPNCECLDYCDAADPYGKPQAKMIRCKPQSPEHLEYHRAWLNQTATNNGFVMDMQPIDDGELWIEIKFKPQVFV